MAMVFAPQVVTLIPGQTPNSSPESGHFLVSGGRKSVLSPDRKNSQTISVYQIYHEKAQFSYTVSDKKTPPPVYMILYRKNAATIHIH